MVGWISLGAAANRSHADAVGVTEVDLGSGDGLAILHLHQRHAVLTPDLSKRVAFCEQGRQPVAIGRHGFWADRVQRHQDVIRSCPEAADPVLRERSIRYPHQACTFGGSGDESAERLE